jgi:hypothetical protein
MPSAIAMAGITASFSTTVSIAAPPRRRRPSSFSPAPTTSRPMAREHRPSASANSCSGLGTGKPIRLMARPTMQAQISGLLAMVSSRFGQDSRRGEA